MSKRGSSPAPDFDTLVDDYERHRTGYSADLIARVIAAAPRSKPDILDVGSGTGLAGKDLLPGSGRFVAIDIASRMLARNPALEKVLGSAAALPVGDGTFDLITCAQAFHWFAEADALSEFHRVLRPEGVAAIWWKYEEAPNPTTEIVEDAFRAIVGKPAPHTDLARSEVPLPMIRPFASSSEEWIPFAVRYTVDSYVGYHASRENLRRGAGPLRGAVLADIRERLLALHGSRPFELPYRQRLILLRR
ncbi:MAG: class I SAM-dependent methyltransferase [Thermoplasmatota archaeon]